MKKQVFSFFSLFILTAQLFSQIGNHPSDIDWKSIENENIRVIYPTNTKAQAQRIANLIKHITTYNTISVGDKSKKINLILQTQQVSSNGFVTLAPFRSEFFGTAPQNTSSLGSTDWLDLLAIHEYRHVLQYANLDRGLTKLLHITNGDFGWGSMINFKVPSWYLEGDAVLSETLLTENGRGRNPNFFKEQRAILSKNKIYSYMKARNGSFKDIVPNQYPLGFVMVNYLRNYFDINTGSKVLAKTGATISPFYTFSTELKKITGLTTQQLYKKSYADIKKKWDKENTLKTFTKSTLVSPKKDNTVTHYTFPYSDTNDGIYCIKKSFKTTSKIVFIKNNTEKNITQIGYSTEEYLSFKNDKLLWTELGVDIRRTNKNYSNVIIYDLKTNSKKQLTKKGKYFSPELSSDGKKIIAVKNDKLLKSNLVVISPFNGEETALIANPENDFISYPKWNKTNSHIVYIVRRNSKLAFFKLELATNLKQQITPWTSHTIGHFNLQDNTIYYTASYNGVDNIYKINISNPQETIQLSEVKSGIFTPIVNTKSEKIIFSEFTLKGYELREMQITPIKKVTIREPIKQDFYDIKITQQEKPILNTIQTNNYEEKKYRGFLKGLKLHSWGADYYNSSVNNQVYYIKANNLLNDLSANFNLSHNRNENTFESKGSVSYGRYFMIANGSFSNTERNIGFITNLKQAETSNFQENKLSFGLAIPLKRIKGNYTSAINFSSNFNYHNTFNYLESPGKKLNFNSYSSKISISNFRRTALQNLAPKFGQYFEFNIHKSFEQGFAENLNLTSVLYFPGFSENHSLSLNAFWNKQPATTSYRFTDRFNYARGYKGIFNKEGSTFRANYQFPVYYPDWGFWNITYFKRIRANLFYDHSSLKAFISINEFNQLADYHLNQNSYGFEILFDNTILNNYSFTFGLRNSFLLDTDTEINKKSYVPELIFSIGF